MTGATATGHRIGREGARIRVLLVDDERLMRSGIAAILSMTPDIEVVAELEDGDQVVAAVQAHRPDVVLLDIQMARQGGIETVAEVKRLATAPRVIMLTTFDTDRLAVRSIAAGADGFLLKTVSNGELLSAIRDVDDGLGAVSPKTAAQLFSRVRDDVTSEHRAVARELVDTLTDRERQVLRGIARGLTNAEIAGELYVSETTVKTYVTAAFGKLGVDNRARAAILADRAGLLAA